MTAPVTVACAALAVLACGIVTPVAAQATADDRSPAVMVSGGMMMAAGYPVGDTTATLRTNAAGTPPPFTLLRAESRLARAIGIEGRVMFGIGRAWAVEASGVYSVPELRVRVLSDPEAPSGADVTARVQQFGVETSAVYQLPWRLGRRTRPYAIGGGGYLRQLHEGRLQVETGATMHLGGGIRHWLRQNAAGGGGLGARAEARYVRRVGGVDFDDRARNLATISLLAFVAF